MSDDSAHTVETMCMTYILYDMTGDVAVITHRSRLSEYEFMITLSRFNELHSMNFYAYTHRKPLVVCTTTNLHTNAWYAYIP